MCAAVFAALVVFAGPASAHAELVASTPSQGAVVGTEPARVALRFSEEIVLKLSAVKVIGPDGRRLDAGALRAGPFGDDSLTVDLAPDARRGTFVVVWQVTAADDGHANSGPVLFAVGTASTPASVAGLGHDPVTSAAYDAGQWIGFAGLAMVGGVAALHTYRRRDGGGAEDDGGAEEDGGAEAGSGAGLARSGAERLQANAAAGSGSATAESGSATARSGSATARSGTVATGSGTAAAGSGTATARSGTVATGSGTAAAGSGTATARSGTVATAVDAVPEQEAASAGPTWQAALGWSLLLIGTLIQVAAYAPAARGLPLSHLVDRSLLSVTLSTREGHALMARLVALAVAAVVGDAVLRRATGPVVPLAFTVAVAATWGATGHAATGGGAAVAMVSLTLHVAAMAVWVGGLFVVTVVMVSGGAALAAVRRFSRLALGAVCVLVATGVYQAWREVGSISALLDTAYGHLVLAKVTLLLCVIVVARGSRWIVATWHDGSQAMLRRNIMIELAGTSVLLLLAVLLAGNAPAR